MLYTTRLFWRKAVVGPVQLHKHGCTSTCTLALSAMNPPAKRTRVHHMAGRVWICGGIIGHAGRGVERVRDPPQRHPRRVSKVEGTELWVRLMIHVTRYSFEVK